MTTTPPEKSAESLDETILGLNAALALVRERETHNPETQTTSAMFMSAEVRERLLLYKPHRDALKEIAANPEGEDCNMNASYSLRSLLADVYQAGRIAERLQP